MESGSDPMYIGIAIGAIVGFIIGYVIGRRTAPGSEQTRQLEEKLEGIVADKQRFEERVTEHFTESAEKLNRLTEQYRDVHQHLAAGAETLCKEGASGAFIALDAPPSAQELPAIESDDVVVEPPRDYAPKSSPGAPGVLNERFGLENDVPPEKREDGDERS